METYFLSFLWGICILFSFTGWGAAVNNILFPGARVDWGQRAAWGIAAVVLMGGILNLASIVSKVSILILTAAGVLYQAVDFYKSRPSVVDALSLDIDNYRKQRLAVFIIFIICFLAVLQYSGLVFTISFNPHDDKQAYFVFAEKMLQTGSIGEDPFSMRRMETSLGGQYFLQTIVLSMLSEKNLNIIDPGLGIIISIGLLWGYLKKRYLKNKKIPWTVAVLILLFFLFIPPPRTNTTALVIPLALFISFFRTLDWEELEHRHFVVNGFIIALIAAAICSLKSTLIPACGILFASTYLFYIFKSKNRPKAVCEFITAAILAVVFLLPWMILMYQSSGTFLYPVLGRGYHGTAYGNFSTPWANLNISGVIEILLKYISYPYITALALLEFAVIKSSRRHTGQREAFNSLVISAALGSLVVLLVTAGRFGERYLYPFLFTAVIISMIHVLAATGWSDKEKPVKSTGLLIVIFVTGMLLGNEWFVTRLQYWDYLRNIKAGLSNASLYHDEDALQYAKMQQSIPEGETVLTRLNKPFLLDFRRNNILIADLPGGASLPPGMPFMKGSEALADYLISKSIRYIAYSYASEAGYPRAYLAKQLRRKQKMHPFFISRSEHTIDFQDNLKELGDTRKRIYDDGDIFVIDLLSRKD
ncbi:MAG: hypothetical protein GXP46_06320 [Deferribacteres bacterium]|nr:hypothetical protein [Deferribacteres bacterium]